MQVNGRVRTPPLSHYAPTNRPYHSYTSSSEDSYGALHSHSRSASGTSQTNYDDPIATPPPRVLMDEYSRLASPNNAAHQRTSSGFRKSQKVDAPDPMTMHLLLETAINDCKNYQILSPEELHEIKKEQKQLSRRLESAKRRLFIESRVNNTSHSLQRLEQKLHKRRSSEARQSGSRDSEVDVDTLNSSIAPVSKKCEALAHNVWTLERRQTELHDRCMRHNAAVFQLNHQLQTQSKQQTQNGQRQINDYDSDDETDSPQLDFNDGFLDTSDAPRNLRPRLQALSGELYGLISQSGPYSRAGYTKPPDETAGSDDDLTYIEMGLSIIKGLHQELARYTDETVEKVRRHEQTTAVLNGLWESVVSGDRDLKRGKLAARAMNGPTLDTEDDSSEDDDSDSDDDDNAELPPFSLPDFSNRVERICERAMTMSKQHKAMHQQLTDERGMNEAANANIAAQIELKLTEIESIHNQLSDHQNTISEQNQRLEELGGERQNMETEIVRLQTELTVARADLDGAYGTRAERANPEAQKELEEMIRKHTDLMSEKADVEERVEMLQKELKDLVTEYESMVKQSVEAEKEREALEGVVDGLKKRIEEAEARLNDEKVRTMGRRNSKSSNGENSRLTEPTSMSVMRVEFKKMMRDARAEHFKSLKAEQEERRRLEAVIRNLRKGPSSPASPTSHGKATLNRTATAP